MTSKVVLGLFALSFTGIMAIQAQNETDALRYSWIDQPGSPRSLGMGGAFGALGADISSFWINPGGLGLYKRNELLLGLGINETGTDANYGGTEASNSAGSFRLRNFGLMGTTPTNEEQGFLTVSYGIGYSRIRDFNDDISIRGTNIPSTLLDVFAIQGTGVHPDEVTDAFPFGAGLAYQCYLIDPTDSNGSSYVPVVDSPADQYKFIQRRGSMSETTFGLATNYDDHLYIGFALGIQSVNYEENATYSESNFDTNESLDNFSYKEFLGTSGVGITFRGGFIYRISDWMRAGVSAQTPSYMALHDTYTADMSSTFRNGDSYSWSSPTGAFNYNLRTPARLMAQTAFVLGKDGLIAADYEYARYGSARLKSSVSDADPYDFSAENGVISSIYRPVHTVRAGIEWRVAGSWRLRGGAMYRQSPYQNGEGSGAPETAFTGGVGFRKDQFFAEFAVIQSLRQDTYYLYDPAVAQPTDLRHSQFQSMLSIGIRY